jgi:hypothetical protein
MEAWESHLSYKKSREISNRLAFFSRVITDESLHQAIPTWILEVEWNGSKEFSDILNELVYPDIWDVVSSSIKEGIIGLLRDIHNLRKKVPPPPTQLWLF